MIGRLLHGVPDLVSRLKDRQRMAQIGLLGFLGLDLSIDGFAQ
jgi:hypothetical protein